MCKRILSAKIACNICRNYLDLGIGLTLSVTANEHILRSAREHVFLLRSADTLLGRSSLAAQQELHSLWPVHPDRTQHNAWTTHDTQGVVQLAQAQRARYTLCLGSVRWWWLVWDRWQWARSTFPSCRCDGLVTFEADWVSRACLDGVRIVAQYRSVIYRSSWL